jgi:hypothetical protein
VWAWGGVIAGAVVVSAVPVLSQGFARLLHLRTGSVASPVFGHPSRLVILVALLALSIYYVYQARRFQVSPPAPFEQEAVLSDERVDTAAS